MIDPGAHVDATADIETDVSIGPRTIVEARAQVRRGARVGADCTISRDVLIDEGVIVGDKVTVHRAALLYRGVIVEDGAFIGPGAILTNERFPRAITSTGDLLTEDLEATPVVARHGCSIGAGAIVIAGVDVGQFATVGAGAVVTRTVPEYALVAGNPARRIGWVCACGIRLVDSSGEAAPATPDLYAQDPDLQCPSCARRYHYVPDAETLVERPGIKQEAPS